MKSIHCDSNGIGYYKSIVFTSVLTEKRSFLNEEQGILIRKKTRFYVNIRSAKIYSTPTFLQRCVKRILSQVTQNSYNKHIVSIKV